MAGDAWHDDIFCAYPWLGGWTYRPAVQVIIGPFTVEEARVWAAAEHSKASPLLAGHHDWWELANMATGVVPLELSRLLDTVVKVCDVADEENAVG